MNGILFVLYTGIGWEHLPQELGWGSGMTCWRRLRDWHAAGVWQRLHHELLQRLHDRGQIDWSRAAVDASSIPAKRGGEETGPNPTDRGRPGTKRHLVVDRCGIPLAVLLSGANVHDSQRCLEVLDAIPGLHIAGRARGRPRKRPQKVHADKAYDSQALRAGCRKRSICPRIARRGIESSERLGRHRWVVERTFAWLNRFRRLTVRYERRADLYLAFTLLGCSLICSRFLPV